MYPRHMFEKDSLKNIVLDNGKVVGFQFDCKIQYYRGAPLSIIRDLIVEVDGKVFDREQIRFSIDGDTFTLDEMETVITYRWRFGQAATISVLTDGGLPEGAHDLKVTQVIAPSYMPMILRHSGEINAILKGEG